MVYEGCKRKHLAYLKVLGQLSPEVNLKSYGDFLRMWCSGRERKEGPQKFKKES
jgi:hypothetical protein